MQDVCIAYRMTFTTGVKIVNKFCVTILKQKCDKNKRFDCFLLVFPMCVVAAPSLFVMDPLKDAKLMLRQT